MGLLTMTPIHQEQQYLIREAFQTSGQELNHTKSISKLKSCETWDRVQSGSDPLPFPNGLGTFLT